MKFDCVSGTANVSSKHQLVKVGAAPSGLPVVPADLNFDHSTAVHETHQFLTEALALQLGWDQSVDGVDTA